IEQGDVASLRGALQVEDDEAQRALATLLPALSSWRRQRQAQRAVDAWRYRVVWQPVADGSVAGDLSGTWLLVVPADLVDHEAEGALAGALEARGARVVVLHVGEADADRAVLAARLRTELSPRDSLGDPGGHGNGRVLPPGGLDGHPLPLHPGMPSL